MCQEDLCYDVLLCDVNFSRFSSHIFLPSYGNMSGLDSQGEIVPIELQIQKKHRYGRKQIGTFPLTVNFAACYCRTFFDK